MRLKVHGRAGAGLMLRPMKARKVSGWAVIVVAVLFFVAHGIGEMLITLGRNMQGLHADLPLVRIVVDLVIGGGMIWWGVWLIRTATEPDQQGSELPPPEPRPDL